MLHCSRTGVLVRLLQASEGGITHRSRRWLPGRRFSVLGDLFRKDAPVDRSHVAVSLFDKESVLQDFTANLDALLSRQDVSFKDYVAFLLEAVYPEKDTLPPLSAYSTLKIVNLLDALTYLLHDRDRRVYRAMLDLIAGELSSRSFLNEEKADIDTMKACIKCLSRICSHSQDVTRLIHNINSEVRCKAKTLLSTQRFVEMVGSLAHIVHPSTIDLIVHTCCCSPNLLLSHDLSQAPKMLSKYKIRQEEVIHPLLKHVVEAPRDRFNGNVQLASLFIANVAHMPPMENQEDHITDRPMKRLTSLMVDKLGSYERKDLIFMLNSIPFLKNMPLDSRKHCRDLIIVIIETLGLPLRISDMKVFEKEMAKAIKRLSDEEFMGVIDVITRADIFDDELLCKTRILQDLLTGRQDADSSTSLIRGSIIQLLASECLKRDIYSRINAETDVTGNIGNTGNSFILAFIRLLGQVYVIGDRTFKNHLKRLSACIKNTALNDHSVIDSIVDEVASMDCNLSKHIVKPVFSLLLNVNYSSTSCLKLIRKILSFSTLHVEAFNDKADHDGFIESVIVHCRDKCKRIMEDGYISRSECMGTLSQMFLFLVSMVNQGCKVDALIALTSTTENWLLDELRSEDCYILPTTIRNIILLPRGNSCRKYIDEFVQVWVNAEPKDTPKLSLETVLVYILGILKEYASNKGVYNNDGIDTIVEEAKRMLLEFEIDIEKHFGRNTYGHANEKHRDHHVWQANVGLKQLFQSPSEPIDAFVLSKMPTLNKYVDAEKYNGLHQRYSNITSLHHLNCHLQQIKAEFTNTGLLLSRSKKEGSEEREKYISIANTVGEYVNRCAMAVEMALPALPNAYLPRKHIQRLVKSALRRFACSST